MKDADAINMPSNRRRAKGALSAPIVAPSLTIAYIERIGIPKLVIDYIVRHVILASGNVGNELG
jgi:hypothetical protein